MLRNASVARDIVDDEGCALTVAPPLKPACKCWLDCTATPMRPKGSGGAGASAANANYAQHNWRALLDNVQAKLG